jgi:ABC-type histidine transport system ATPase subunit
MIEIKDVRKSYGELEVIKGVSLTVEKGLWWMARMSTPRRLT